jgi:protoheme IX farnesyltransferase
MSPDLSPAAATMGPASVVAAAPAGIGVARGRAQALADYLELTKPRITLLVLVTTLVGFVLGAPRGTFDLWRLAHVLIGTGLTAAGASALNQFLEREADARMHRTRRRPLPAGLLSPDCALVFAIDAATLGVVWLTVAVNRASALVAALTLASYALAYTPLKRRTPWSTVVGAVPGALPPVIGWVGASGELAAGAQALFAILFLWQLPHFFAIGWLYREDYGRGQFRLLPVIDQGGALTARVILGSAGLLVLASFIPAFIGMTGSAYLAGAAILGLGFLGCGVAFARSRHEGEARRLFKASLLYLPAILALMLLDRTPR